MLITTVNRKIILILNKKYNEVSNPKFQHSKKMIFKMSGCWEANYRQQ